jgi:minor histocompatibility antigen H13
MLSLGSYVIGVILLCGLFVYDVFWVFGTEVMVSVAKGLNAPIKLMFPKALGVKPMPFSMLGLGDIVIPVCRRPSLCNGIATVRVFHAGVMQLPYPSRLVNFFSQGIFVAMMLRFDSRQGLVSQNYFYVNFLSYILGLCLTVGVMHFFDSAQPALLYLVPACILSSLFTAAFRGELKTLLTFTEEQSKQDGDDKKAR